MKEALITLVDKLVEKGFNTKKVLMEIIAPLNTVEQVQAMMDYLEENPQANEYRLKAQAIEIQQTVK